jgi:hypothetical protein
LPQTTETGERGGAQKKCRTSQDRITPVGVFLTAPTANSEEDQSGRRYVFSPEISQMIADNMMALILGKFIDEVCAMCGNEFWGLQFP